MRKLAVFGGCLLAISAALAEEKSDKDWKLHTELSYVKTSGNSKTETFAVKSEGEKEIGKNRLTGKGDFLYAKNNGVENANRLFLLGRWERLISEKLFGFAQGDYLNDKFSGFNYKFVGSLGVGYDVVKKENLSLGILTSIGYTKLDYKQATSEEFSTGIAEVKLDWDIQSNVKFKQDLKYEVSMEDTKIYFLYSDTSVEVKINSILSLGVGYKIAYQNTPPSKDIKKTDTTFLTSLIVDF